MGDAQVHVLVTGIGIENATREIRAALDDTPDVCFSSGLAGGLKPEYALGEIVVARAVQGEGSQSFTRSDQSLVELAVRCGARAVDVFHTADKMLLTAKDKFRLGARADVVDMESSAIMREMSTRGVPVVAVRAISDPAGAHLPLDFGQVLGRNGDVSLQRLLARLARRPQRLPAMMRFGFASLRSAALLARFLDRFLEALVDQDRFEEMVPSMEVG